MEEEQEKRDEEGGFEEAALRTRTTERPVCGGKAEREKGNTRRREDGERNGGRARGGKGRESQRRERPAKPTSTRTNCFTGKSFAVLISRCDSFRNRAARRERDREILESSSKFPSHRGQLRNLRGVSIFRGSLLEYHERVGSNRT